MMTTALETSLTINGARDWTICEDLEAPSGAIVLLSGTSGKLEYFHKTTEPCKHRSVLELSQCHGVLELER